MIGFCGGRLLLRRLLTMPCTKNGRVSNSLLNALDLSIQRRARTVGSFKRASAGHSHLSLRAERHQLPGRRHCFCHWAISEPSCPKKRSRPTFVRRPFSAKRTCREFTCYLQASLTDTDVRHTADVRMRKPQVFDQCHYPCVITPWRCAAVGSQFAHARSLERQEPHCNA